MAPNNKLVIMTLFHIIHHIVFIQQTQHRPQFIQSANYTIPISGYPSKVPIYAPEQQIIMMQQPQEPIYQQQQQQQQPIPTQRRTRMDQVQYSQQRNGRRGNEPKQKNKRETDMHEQNYINVNGGQGDDISSLSKDDLPWPKPTYLQDPNSPPDFFNIIGRGNLPSFTFEPER
ncbi:uncharacterized protein GO595_001143 [Histomonas meleagridis]|uniref:uncharacterized protein n=1 Tax=Histomonas meleagridis TaxID=135588 RepID=UPI003559E75F|nr:hypothetical protein GO595_001143 [Histomonas meleagridis]